MKVKQMLDIEGHHVAFLHGVELGGRGGERVGDIGVKVVFE
jgi:hypothetical protein